MMMSANRLGDCWDTFNMWMATFRRKKSGNHDSAASLAGQCALPRLAWRLQRLTQPAVECGPSSARREADEGASARDLFFEVFVIFPSRSTPSAPLTLPQNQIVSSRTLRDVSCRCVIRLQYNAATTYRVAQKSKPLPNKPKMY